MSAVSAAVSGCSDLKQADGDASGAADGGTLAEGFGPGPKGSLPLGYCCNADAECRGRHCVAVGGGGRMCLDTCGSTAFCRLHSIDFSCDATMSNPFGTCHPTNANLACIPQAQFERGVRKTGACCDGTSDGLECEGSRCTAEGDDNPFVCSEWCDSTKTCPSGTVCNTEFHNCAPANRPYTCQ